MRKPRKQTPKAQNSIDPKTVQAFDDMIAKSALAEIFEEFFRPRPNQRKIDKLMIVAQPHVDDLQKESEVAYLPHRPRIAKSVLDSSEHRWLRGMGVKW